MHICTGLAHYPTRNLSVGPVGRDHFCAAPCDGSRTSIVGSRDRQADAVFDGDDVMHRVVAARYIVAVLGHSTDRPAWEPGPNLEITSSASFGHGCVVHKRGMLPSAAALIDLGQRRRSVLARSFGRPPAVGCGH